MGFSSLFWKYEVVLTIHVSQLIWNIATSGIKFMKINIYMNIMESIFKDYECESSIMHILLMAWVRSLGWEDPLEKELATHCSTLAWKIPWIEEPGRLQSDMTERLHFLFFSCWWLDVTSLPSLTTLCFHSNNNMTIELTIFHPNKKKSSRKGEIENIKKKSLWHSYCPLKERRRFRI